MPDALVVAARSAVGAFLDDDGVVEEVPVVVLGGEVVVADFLLGSSPRVRSGAPAGAFVAGCLSRLPARVIPACAERRPCGHGQPTLTLSQTQQ